MSKKFLLSAALCFTVFGMAASTEPSTTTETFTVAPVPTTETSVVAPAIETPELDAKAKDINGVSIRKSHHTYGDFPKVRQGTQAKKACARYCSKHYVQKYYNELTSKEKKVLQQDCAAECMKFNKNHGNTNQTILRQSKHHKK